MSDPSSGGSRAKAARIKYLAIVVALLASAITLTASTQTWYTIHLTASSGHAGALTVSGSDAAPAIAALSLAGIAFAGALALAGRVLRYVLAVLGIALAASIVGSIVSALVDPVGTGITIVTKATGIAGDTSVRAIVASTDATAWPAIALVGGILLGLTAVTVAATAHLWPSASRRYGATTDASAPVSTEPTAAPSARDAAIDDWDELSRGDDPSEHGGDHPRSLD